MYDPRIKDSIFILNIKYGINISRSLLFYSFLIIILNSCIVPYFPEPVENEEMIVVEGSISDQHEINTIKLSRSFPLWKTQNAKPLKGCKVWISDDMGIIDSLKETTFGTYITDSTKFQGKIGRKYKLHINVYSPDGNVRYESFPTEMKPVPPIESIYYEKTISEFQHNIIEGCQIYLDTQDPKGNCNFYRWKFSETWEFHLPYNVANKVCWITESSNKILIKNASLLTGGSIVRYPINSINNPVDKLSVKYSILVEQYSLNEDEYLYWERLTNTVNQVGGLYDLIPSFIPNNLYCLENPNEKILGYFSVSSVSSKRLFIKDTFAGWNTKYVDCISDTILGTKPIDGLNSSVWVIIDNSDKEPPNRIVTYMRGCADCRDRGTTNKPYFWDEDVH